MKRLTPLLLASLLASGCATYEPTHDDSMEVEPDVPDRYSVGRYFVNRGLDFGDMFKFGAELGPGMGVDLMASSYLRAAAMKRWSKGIGFETFRYSPFKDADESYAELGPVAQERKRIGQTWPLDTWDLRAELHLLVVGAHVAVNPFEMVDFLAGLATFDPSGDDTP